MIRSRSSFGAGEVAFDWRPPMYTNGATFSFDVGEQPNTQSAVDAGATGSYDTRGRYSSLVGLFSGGRFYFSASNALKSWGTQPWQLSALLCCTASGARCFALGTPDNSGSGGLFSFYVNTSNVWNAFVNVVGGGSVSWVSAVTRDTTKMERLDLCYDGLGHYGFFINGVLISWQSNANPILDQVSKFAIGGSGEYTAGGYLGAYGDRWSGLIERVVLLKGACLAPASGNFDPYDPRPFFHT
jgi:hypothetical protein